MNEKFSHILNDPKAPIGIGVVSFVVGVGVGFGLNHILNRRKKQFPLDAHQVPKALGFDEERLKNFLHKEETRLGITPPKPAVIDEPEPDKESPEEEMTTESEEAQEETITLVFDEETEVEVGVVTHNVFAENTSDWNYDEEIKSRSSSAPYVLHKDEFYADELGYTQNSLIYYAGDDIMVDEDDKPVYNYREIVGELRFGHGADSPTVFYVRNDKRHAEYEISYDPGLFSVEVLGLNIEDNQRAKDLKHSHHVPRFYQD